jgi:4-alpha-glucanotransferase
LPQPEYIASTLFRPAHYFDRFCTVQVSEFAAAKRVVLKGDLPIGVDKRSVDTWMEVCVV